MNKLRLAFATPWNEKSAIAQHSAELIAELSKLSYEVAILRTEVGEAKDLAPRVSDASVFHLDNLTNSEIQNKFDVVIAQIGNNCNYHGALPFRIKHINAVGIFHDSFLGHFAYGWAKDENYLRKLVYKFYGEDAWPKDEGYFNNLALSVDRRPFLEWLACSCIGAISHSGHYIDRLKKSCPGPTALIPLALTFPELPPPPMPWDHLTIAVIGDANPNKRIDQLILAIAASPKLRKCCDIKIIGETTAEMKKFLIEVATISGINIPHFYGWVSDKDLPWLLRDVDVICCLRNPITEGASASLLFAMHSRRPTIVTNHGSFAEAPDGTVLRCDPAFEARDVLGHLENILDRPDQFKQMTERAKSHVSNIHTPSFYVQSLLPFLEKVVDASLKASTKVQIQSTLDSFGLSTDDSASSRIDSHLDSLFNHNDRSTNIEIH